MNIISHILLGSGKLTPYVDQIKREFDSAVDQIAQKIPITEVDVVIYDNPEGAIPEIGVGGYTPNSYLVFIYLDPQFSDFHNTITKELKRTSAHEMHHAIRWRNPGYGKTLLEALITEGLADHFDIEVNNESPEPWCTALSEEQIQDLLVKAKEEFNNKNYDHHAWFFGSAEKGIPRWTGYSLGFKLVESYLQKHPDKKPSTLYDAKAEELIG